jgi:pyridoxamine 5'-phosphate oxidase
MPADLTLPDPLPSDPMPLFQEWFRDAAARRAQPNPNAMIVATTATSGDPSARVVLCKRIDGEGGYVVFFTNYQSRKGRELAARPRAAAVFHWDALHRQVRIEGPVVLSPESESDQYFASRALDSRIAAWASVQSEPLASRDELHARVLEFAARFGVAPGATTGTVPRPPHWGGHRLWVDTIELWTEGANRIHDRAVWTRSLQRADEFSFVGGSWRSTRLNP